MNEGGGYEYIGTVEPVDGGGVRDVDLVAVVKDHFIFVDGITQSKHKHKRSSTGDK